MRKSSTAARKQTQIVNAQKLTIGIDLGDRFSYYFVLDQAGELIVEDKLPTTKQGMQQVFGKLPPAWPWRPERIPRGSAGSSRSWDMK